MRIARRLFEVVTQNAGWKLLSLAIAVVVWGLVANEPELSTFVTVGVEYKNLPEDLEISSDPVAAVKLELRGPSGELGGASLPEVILDMSKVEPGERTFPIGAGTVKVVRGVQFVRAIPSTVRFHFERHRENVVKVTPRFTERGGYQVRDFSVSAGPSSHVRRIDSVLTDPVDIPAQAGTFDYTVNAFVDDPYVRLPNTSRVTVHITVAKE